MSKSFGPWATTLDTGTSAPLSTFWQRRMAMLGTLKTGETRVSWTLRGALIAGAVAVLALPLVYLSRSADGQAESATRAKPESRAAAPAEPEPTTEFLPVPSPSEKRILAALNESTTIDVIETPLRDVVKDLQERHNIQIQLDVAAMEGAGSDPDGIITLDVKDVQLESALQWLLRPINLAYVIKDEVLLITTKDVADNELRTRTYPVGDLIDGKDDKAFDNLKKAIFTTVRKYSWEDTGGLGTVTPVPKSRSLVISQTRDVHDEVLALLRALRAARQTASQ